MNSEDRFMMGVIGVVCASLVAIIFTVCAFDYKCTLRKAELKQAAIAAGYIVVADGVYVKVKP